MSQIQTPDLTLVQKLGGAALLLLGSIFGLLEAFGHPLTNAQTIAISTTVTSFVSVAVVADAVIRNGRSRIAAAKAMPKPPATPRAR